jgi:activating signal cointegrator complex subunit 2
MSQILFTDRFWSQVVYDASLHTSLVSFLQEAPRFFSEEIEMLKKNNTWELLKEIKKLVFLTFLRMSTHKESKVLAFL